MQVLKAALGDIGAFILADLISSTGIIVPSIVSLFVGVVGTYLGARFAFRNLKHAQKRENAFSELHGLRKALHFAIATTNNALSMKRQHIADLVSGFESNREKIVKELGLPTVKKTFEATYDFKFLQEAGFFGDELLDAVLAVDPGVTGAQEAMNLKASCETFNALVNVRNALIEEVRRDDLDEFEMMRRYFGLYLSPGVRDDRFKDTIESLGEVLDDIIFFSRDLSRRLAVRIIERRAELRRLGREFDVEVPVMLLNEATKGLVPETEQYEQWIKQPEIWRKRKWESKRKTDKALKEAILSDLTQEEFETILRSGNQ